MSTNRKLLQIISVIVVLTMLFSGFQAPAASAQGNNGIKRGINAHTGRVSFIGPLSGRVLPAASALGLPSYVRPSNPGMALANRYGTEFGLKNPGRELKEVKTNKSRNGRMTIRYQQQYQDIPVIGGELVINTNVNGDLYSMNGEVSPNISIPTQPAVSFAQAQQTALQATAKWYDLDQDDVISSEPELWFYDENLLRPSTRPVELVWRMEVTTTDVGTPIRELVLVNAEKGTISLHYNQIDTGWSVSGEAGIAQDITPTVTPQPTETLPPTETTEPIVTPSPIETFDVAVTPTPIEEMKPNEEMVHSHIGGTQSVGFTGTTRYVTTTGSSSSSCTLASPCNSIQRAVNLSTTNSGDIVKVEEGVYYRPAINTNPNVLIIDRNVL
ncbi:MAG TPA: hypothetical protein VK141_09355, partial [Nitrosomonas sp.]|nr:hypothetical protein [Nitrosomonas sp.]